MSKIKLEKIKPSDSIAGESLTALGKQTKVCSTNVMQEVSAGKPTKRIQDERKRNWTFVIYPDSAPQNWQEILDEEHIEWIKSPLHDKDVNADGTPKKPHWHIILLFDGNKSYEQIKEIADKVHAPSPKYIQSVRAMVRYCAHLDNPDKAQYKVSDIIGHGGVDLAELLKPTASSRYEHISEMIDYISDNHVTEFIDFMRYAKKNRYDDWFPLLCDSAAFIIREVIKSNRFKKSQVQPLTEEQKNEVQELVKKITEGEE